MIVGENLEERPDKLDGKTLRMETGCGTMHITLNATEDYPIFEVFSVGGKNGSCHSVFVNFANIMISRALRLGDDPREIIDDIRHLTCPKSYGNGTKSCPQALAECMEKFLDESYDWDEIDEFEVVTGLDKSELEKSEETYSEVEGNETKDEIENNSGFEKCPECGEMSFNPASEGCSRCTNPQCGYSPCN